MIESPPLDGRALLDVLARADVQFIVVGGFAVIAHGYQRATRDIDIVPEPTIENFRRLLAGLGELDYAIHDTEEFEPTSWSIRTSRLSPRAATGCCSPASADSTSCSQSSPR